MVLDLIRVEILKRYGLQTYEAVEGNMAEVPSRICGHLGKEVKEIYDKIISNEEDLDKIIEEFKFSQL